MDLIVLLYILISGFWFTLWMVLVGLFFVGRYHPHGQGKKTVAEPFDTD